VAARLQLLLLLLLLLPLPRHASQAQGQTSQLKPANVLCTTDGAPCVELVTPSARGWLLAAARQERAAPALADADLEACARRRNARNRRFPNGRK
jgi:hypothetical protein